MHVDQFEMRLAIVRHHFATTLGSKIEDALISTNQMSKGDAGVNKRIAESYRSLHGICGIGPTVGFCSTGEAAHFAEAALMPANRERRGLTEREVLNLKKALEHLRVVAASELRMMYQRGG